MRATRTPGAGAEGRDVGRAQAGRYLDVMEQGAIAEPFFRPYVPRGPLRLQFIWIARGQVAHRRERVLPNGVVELDLIDRAFPSELNGQVLEARTDAERIACVERLMTKRLDSRLAGHDAVRSICDSTRRARGVVRIGDLVARTGLSHRRVMDYFARDVGMAPKPLNHEVGELHAFGRNQTRVVVRLLRKDHVGGPRCLPDPADRRRTRRLGSG